jgi:hypothetical protein
VAERNPRPRIDVADSSWIEQRLTGGARAITRQIPSGYARYVRICHPVEDRDGNWVSWSTVGESTGRHPHALMQWHALVGSADELNMRGSLWAGQNPRRGNLAPHVLAALARCSLTGPPPPRPAYSVCGLAMAGSSPRRGARRRSACHSGSTCFGPVHCERRSRSGNGLRPTGSSRNPRT